jgi:hypothetical protein
MTRRSDRDIGRVLSEGRAPREAQAGDQTWRVVRSVYAERPAGSRARPRARFALAPAAIVIAGVLALTPAGAAVHRWIDQTLGVKHARTALFSLPAPGQILVAGQGGAWTVAADGSKRRLGSWREATWSPHALYVAVASHDELTAVNLRGTPQWSIARPDVRSPRWFAPNGYRIAYLSATTVRVITGAGTGDRQLASGVAAVAPSWRPAAHQYALAYATTGGAVVVRDGDTGRIAWWHRTMTRPRLLSWSSDGSRLLVLTRADAYVFDPRGRLLIRVGAAGAPALDAALSPNGQELAVLSDRDVTITDLSKPGRAQRRVFTGAGLRQLAWSPDGDWILVGWPAADQWVFIHSIGRPRIIAVSRIAEQFSGAGRRRAFPAIEGWCCTAPGGAS